MEGRDVFFIGNHAHDSYFKEVVRQLVARKCIYGYMSHALLDTKADDLCFLDSTLLYRSQHFEQAFENIDWTFGTYINIDSIGGCRAEVYAAHDRISPFQKSIAEKELFFNKLSGFYIGFFEAHRGIRKILTRQTPHMPWDILFCRIALKFGIKVYSVDRGVPGFAVIWSGFGECAIKYQGPCLNDSAVNALYNTIDKHNSTNRLYVKTFLPLKKNKVSSKKILMKLLPFLGHLWRFKNLWLEPIPLKHYPADLDSKPNTSFAAEERVSRIDYVLISVAYDNARRRREKYLNVMGNRSPAFESDYVYFALHFQPEATTLPKGLIYREQALAIRRLSEIIPDGMVIYVKEHPRQQVADIRNKNYRNIDFYEEILRLENVNLVHTEVDSAELIEHSALVATITGSPLVEALQRGIPVIAFGNSIVEEM